MHRIERGKLGFTFSAVLAFIAALGSTGAAADAPPIREIDVARSKAQFSIQHIFVDRVTGTVAIRSGSVELPPAGAIPTRVSAELDATRIKTDEPDRDTALESSDYFDVRVFPTWTFSSTQIVTTGAAGFDMHGLLTLHGVTRPEKLSVTISGDPLHPVYHATGPIDRHAFGMKGARLDPVIGNSADITLDIVLR